MKKSFNDKLSNGTDENFFPARSEAAFPELELWLSEREFSDVNTDEGLKDKHGKPLVTLLLKVEGADGKPRFKKRGVIWFKSDELKESALSIIEKHKVKNR